MKYSGIQEIFKHEYELSCSFVYLFFLSYEEDELFRILTVTATKR